MPWLFYAGEKKRGLKFVKILLFLKMKLYWFSVFLINGEETLEKKLKESRWAYSEVVEKNWERYWEWLWKIEQNTWLYQINGKGKKGETEMFCSHIMHEQQWSAKTSIGVSYQGEIR